MSNLGGIDYAEMKRAILGGQSLPITPQAYLHEHLLRLAAHLGKEKNLIFQLAAIELLKNIYPHCDPYDNPELNKRARVIFNLVLEKLSRTEEHSHVCIDTAHQLETSSTYEGLFEVCERMVEGKLRRASEACLRGARRMDQEMRAGAAGSAESIAKSWGPVRAYSAALVGNAERLPPDSRVMMPIIESYEEAIDKLTNPSVIIFVSSTIANGLPDEWELTRRATKNLGRCFDLAIELAQPAANILQWVELVRQTFPNIGTGATEVLDRVEARLRLNEISGPALLQGIHPPAADRLSM